MSACYTVLVLTKDAELLSCDHFSGFKAANEKALELSNKFAKNKDWIVKEPACQKVDYGFRWIYYGSNHCTVVVTFVNIVTPDNTYPTHVRGLTLPGESLDLVKKPDIGSLLNAPASVSLNPSVYFPSPPFTKPVDEPFADFMPIGFSVSGKPLTVADVKHDCSTLMRHSGLTAAQMKALVIARINKQPNYSIKLRFGYMCGQYEAIAAVKSGSIDSLEIIEFELNSIDEFLDTLSA